MIPNSSSASMRLKIASKPGRQRDSIGASDLTATGVLEQIHLVLCAFNAVSDGGRIRPNAREPAQWPSGMQRENEL